MGMEGKTGEGKRGEKGREGKREERGEGKRGEKGREGKRERKVGGKERERERDRERKERKLTGETSCISSSKFPMNSITWSLALRRSIWYSCDQEMYNKISPVKNVISS